MVVGILALQGAVAAHQKKFQELGVEAKEVRSKQDLIGIDGLVIPGGESTVMLKLLHTNKMWDECRDFLRDHASWGVCAGAILLATTVESPAQESLGQIDIVIERNAYGRQLSSFISSDLIAHNQIQNQEGVFIRAPRIKSCGPEVQILLSYQTDPVLVRQNRCLVSTFHPELSPGHKIHEVFLDMI